MKTIKHLYEIDHPENEELVLKSSANLGGPDNNIQQARNWLRMNAAETDEQGVIDEINFVGELL